MSRSADPRRRAVTVLARVDALGAHAARLLADAVPVERELVLGTLRWQAVLDGMLVPHLGRPLGALDAEVRACLRCGLYEAKHLDTPAAIAVSEAVRVAGTLVPRAKGLVNAVLRRAVRTAWPDPADASLPLAVRFSHPAWLVERWLGRLGEAATTRALDANQRPARLWLLEAVTDTAALESAGCALTPHAWVPGVVGVIDGAQAAVAALRRGQTYAIDPVAVAVARLIPDGAQAVLDLAAAPGGKALVTAAERGPRRHVAGDRHLGRVALMRRTLARAGGGGAVVTADAAAPPYRARSWPVVVLDAPCSGTGTLRRHPEIRWRLRPEDLGALGQVQRELARAAAELVAPGGVLLYATCSLEPEENDGIVAGLGLDPVPVADALPGAARAIRLESGGVLIPPGPDGDGFVAHMLRRPV